MTTTEREGGNASLGKSSFMSPIESREAMGLEYNEGLDRAARRTESDGQT
jgi:hypothetical protein